MLQLLTLCLGRNWSWTVGFGDGLYQKSRTWAVGIVWPNGLVLLFAAAHGLKCLTTNHATWHTVRLFLHFCRAVAQAQAICTSIPPSPSTDLPFTHPSPLNDCSAVIILALLYWVSHYKTKSYLLWQFLYVFSCVRVFSSYYLPARKNDTMYLFPWLWLWPKIHGDAEKQKETGK